MLTHSGIIWKSAFPTLHDSFFTSLTLDCRHEPRETRIKHPAKGNQRRRGYVQPLTSATRFLHFHKVSDRENA